MELKKLMLSELIDGEMIVGAAIIDSNNIPIIHHLPTTLTLKSLRNVMSLLEVAQRSRKLSDDLLGSFNYILIKYSNFKIAFFNMTDKGWLIVFVNPVWHVENAMPKIRQFMVKAYKLI
ncbi:hypothetical protein [Caldivirga sp.]|jgi:hypothetical protein|uniref:hypothetical protein n=2 Tax=Caldivirga sp. TaxID=2080243 RepID=UPI0025BE299C|nr:hypothetical protein [Caldivirga sp.]